MADVTHIYGNEIVDAQARQDCSNLKDDLTLFTGNIAYSYTKDKSINISTPLIQSTEINWESVIVACNAGDIFSVKGIGGNNTRLWFFASSDGTVLSQSNAGVSTLDYITIIAPQNAAYLSCNSKYTSIEGSLVKGTIVRNDIDTVKDKISNYDMYNSAVFTGNYAMLYGYFPKGTIVTVSTVDGSNFSGGTIFFYNDSVQTDSMGLLTSESTRFITLTADAYRVQIGGETIPTNIKISPVFPYHDKYAYWAYLTSGNYADYDPTSGKLNLKTTSLCIWMNGQTKTISHSDMVTQLSSVASEDANGNLIVTMGGDFVLAYDTLLDKLVRVSDVNFRSIRHIPIYGVSYANGNGGLLVVSSNAKKIWNNRNITPVRLLNSSPSYDDANFQTKLQSYEQTVADASVHNEQFLLFSDPHCVDDIENILLGMMSTIEKFYNCSSADYVLCGGDWLNNNDSLASAVYKIGYVKGIGKSMLGGNNFYNIIGNHDTNYQGATALTENQLRNLWYSGGKCYYKIEKPNCTYYALDTGVDNDDTLTSYRLEQLEWLCQCLATDDEEHSAIFMHIVFTSASDSSQISAMATTVGNIITAYNSRGTITVNENSYTFSACTGIIKFVLCGHVHKDFDTTLGGVPCVSVTNTNANGNGTATFDMCVADFDNGKLHMIRVGNGSDRTFDI